MKYLTRVFLFNTFALWLTSQLLPALVISGDWQTIAIAGIILTLLMLLVAPIVRILFIPINFLTLGLASWLGNVIIVYLLTIFIPQVAIQPWTFPGLTWQGFSIPSYHVSYMGALVISTLAITLVSNILRWLAED